MLVFFHHPDCVIWFYLLGWNHFLSIKGEIFRRSCWKKNCWPFPVSTQRVFPGQLPGLPGSTRFFQPRNDFYQFNFDTLESGYSQFFFLVRGKPEGVKLCSACSSCFQSGDAFLKQNPKKKIGDFWHTATEPFGHPIGRSRRLEKLNFQGKRQDSTILIFDPLKSSDESHHSNKRSIWYIFLGPYFVPIISSKSKSTRELGCFGRQKKTTRGSTIS